MMVELKRLPFSESYEIRLGDVRDSVLISYGHSAIEGIGYHGLCLFFEARLLNRFP